MEDNMSKRAHLLAAVQRLIYKEYENTILSHAKTWLEANENRYFGSLKGNKFQVWRFTRGAQGFHPVITGEISTNEQSELTVHLRPNLNPLGILLATIGIPASTIFIVFVVSDGLGLPLALLVAFGTVLALVSIVLFIYRYETRYHLIQLNEKIDSVLQQGA